MSCDQCSLCFFLAWREGKKAPKQLKNWIMCPRVFSPVCFTLLNLFPLTIKNKTSKHIIYNRQQGYYIFFVEFINDRGGNMLIFFPFTLIYELQRVVVWFWYLRYRTILSCWNEIDDSTSKTWSQSSDRLRKVRDREINKAMCHIVWSWVLNKWNIIEFEWRIWILESTLEMKSIRAAISIE